MISVAILGKLIQYYILPLKYLNDSGRMQSGWKSFMWKH